MNRVVEPAELMPAALKLAHEMASIEADMLVTYKAMIDDGYALPHGRRPGAGARALGRPQRRGHAGDGRGPPRGGAGARPDAVARECKRPRLSPDGAANSAARRS